MSSWSPSNGLRNLVSSLLNKFLAPYVEGLNTDQLNISLWSGEVVLRNLKIKKEALDKFRLPVDVIEGHLGTLHLSVPYSSLGTKPVRIIIEDVYLLAVPSGETKSEPGEQEQRDQAAKQERLDAAEAFDIKSQVADGAGGGAGGGGAAGAADQKKNESLMAGMIANIINNLQVTVRNIHLRYEDKLSTPDHPFAVGVTLAEFVAVSTDENWVETFIHNTHKALHKIARLSSLALYFDTDVGTIAGADREATLANFSHLITRGGADDVQKLQAHQFILKPVSGEARLIMNHRIDKETPQVDAQVLFDEFGFLIDDDQYRDTLSMVDLFHFYTRTQQYTRFRPPEEEFRRNPARARLKFATTAIRAEIHEKDRKWSWAYFAERRDDRRAYVDLYTRRKRAGGGGPNNAPPFAGAELARLEALERKLPYEDIRFYRSIAKAELRKDAASRRRLEEEKAKAAAAQPPQGWIGWAFGAATAKKAEVVAPEAEDEGTMTESDRRGLLSLVGYNPDAGSSSSTELADDVVPRDALKLRLSAKLKTGSLALRRDPHGLKTDVLAIVWDALQADAVKYTDSMDATVTLGGFRVYDGTTPNSVYPQIVRVKDDVAAAAAGSSSSSSSSGSALDGRRVQTTRGGDNDTHDEPLEQQQQQPLSELSQVASSKNPFFSLRFEHNPLDQRADNAVTVKMRHLEIIYHKAYVENVFRFFKPPESQLESINALIDVASETLDGIRKETRAGLEFALQQHKTVDIKLDMNAPIIIIPEDVVDPACQHVVLDAGHIAVESNLVSKEALAKIRAKEAQQYTDDDFKNLENLMYDRFTIRLEAAQLLMGPRLETCLKALESHQGDSDFHILERINLTFSAQNAILNAPNLTRFKVAGDLPNLQLNFSDTKYKTLMRFIDVTIPKFDDGGDEGDAASTVAARVAPKPPTIAPPPRHNSTRSGGGFLNRPVIEEYNLEEHEDVVEDTPGDAPKDEFFDAPDIATDPGETHQKTFEFHFAVDKVQASLFKSTGPGRPERHLADAALEGFALEFALRKFDLGVDVSLRSISLDMIRPGKKAVPLVSSNDVNGRQSTADLIKVQYAKVQKDSPEFQTVFEGVDQTVQVELSTFNVLLDPAPVLDLYDWIMTTFVPEDRPEPMPVASSVAPTSTVTEDTTADAAIVPAADGANQDKIRVRVKMVEFGVLLQHDDRRLATLSMSAGDVSLLLRGPTMRLAATLGQLSIVDDQAVNIKNILSFDGEDLLDFSYETFDPSDPDPCSYDAMLFLRTGSLKLYFLERPIRDLYQWSLLFSRLQEVYTTPAIEGDEADETEDVDAGDESFDLTPAGQPAAPAKTLAFRIEILDPTIFILADDAASDSQAIRLSVDQILMSQQGILALNVQKLGMSLLRMDRPKETLRFLDEIDIVLSMDSRQVSSHQTTDIELNVEPVIFRASYRDILLITEIVNKGIAIAASATHAEEEVQKATDEVKASEPVASLAPPPTTRPRRDTRTSRASISTSPSRARRLTASRTEKPKILLSTEHLKASFEGFQLVLIGDLHELPLLHLHTRPFKATVQDWSGDMKFITALKPSIKYYNLTNSAWEPLLEPYSFMLRVSRSESGGDAGKMAVSFSSEERLELNVTSTFIELAITSYTQWTKESDRILNSARGGDAPYLIKNRTGYPIDIWADKRDTRGRKTPVANGEDIPWRFEDYKTIREHVGESMHHSLGLLIHEADWEQLRDISVDKEGYFSHALRPRLDKNPHRLICNIELIKNVKVVTFRSPLRVENLTHVPVELIIIEKTGKPSPTIYKIAPGEDFPLPIEAAYHKRFKIRPDPGFDFSWSSESLHWEDLRSRPVRAIACKSHEAREAPFRFQASAVIEGNESNAKRYPQLSLRLRAPVEIENLLPYDIKYRVFDKNTSLNTSIFLRKGGISPVHQVELSHLLLLSVQVQDAGLKPSEFAIINTDNPDDFNIEDTLVLTDLKGLKLNLKIHYVRYPDPSGAFKVQVYSPYVFLNKTGLPWAVRSKTWMGQPRDAAGSLDLRDDYLKAEPTPLMFSFANDDRRNKCLLKFGDSMWSKPLSFETVAADMEVINEAGAGRHQVHTGLSYVEGLGKYKLSKVVTLTPRFLIKNNLSETISVRQEGSDGFVHLGQGERGPLHRFVKRGGGNGEEPRVVIALQGLNEVWSAPFNITEIGRVHVTLPRKNPTTGQNKSQLVRVEVIIEGPSIFVHLSNETDPWPFKIQNETDEEFQFCQTDVKTTEGVSEGPRKARTMHTAHPFSSADYAWELPAESNKRLKIIANGRERLVDVMEIGVLAPFRFTDKTGHSRIASLDVRAEGPSQLLIITNYEESHSAFKPTGRGTLSRTSTMDSNVAFEAVPTDTSVNMTVSVDFEGVGISVVNKRMQELVYMSFRGLELRYVDTATSYSASVNCKWIQIDNQLFGGIYPIIFYPSVAPKDGKDLDSHPTLQSSVIVLKDETHGVLYIKYASILIQAITVELDEDFAYALYDFSQFDGAAWQEQPEDVLIENPGPIPDAKPDAGGPPVYFESLALQPMQLELSFMRTEHVNVQEKQRSTRNPLLFVLNALTMALGNVNAAPVRLNALMIENVRLSMPALQSRVMLHYTNQFTYQLYRILGSADAFGNPVGLFTNVSSGVHDIFYEPYQGFVLHGNKDLASGIARGASSFVKKTVFGVSDSISKVTGSIGKGISAATLDPEYQARRRMAQRRNKPRHALYGLAAGAQAFGTSVASGLEGLALKPIEGAESGGAGGFFKGVGKGLVGIVTKPVVGVFDFASTATQGIRNTTTVFEGADIDRIRLPRFTAADGVLRPFSGREALGQSWLKDLENGKYFNETYVAHLDFPNDDTVCMLTTTRILLIRSIKLRVVWEVAFWELQTISLEPSGIALLLRDGVQGPFLPLPETSSRMWLWKNLERVLRAYNASRASVDGA